MLRFSCPSCSSEIFFNTFDCLACGSSVAYSPGGSKFVLRDERNDCGNRREYQICNWVMDGGGPFCLACLTNQMIPDLTVPGNREKWEHLERSKRRLFYNCLRLGIDTSRVGFRFLASTPNEAAVTGHCAGTITVNLGEADPVTREQTKQSLNEKFRTLIGHFRHEFGHYYWENQITPDPILLEKFRELFGDEREDYQASLDQYYSGDWAHGHEFISVYASSHPWEDWAETFAHYLHLRDALETSEQFGLTESKGFEFERGVEQWIKLSVAFNEINRSLGLQDLYPFTLTSAVIEKLRFVHRVVVGNPLY
ncbi:MAG: putative zinc-binding metallopeptidase [Vulcanimicrobiota bacterium]